MGTSLHPIRQRLGTCPAVARSLRESVRVHRIHGGPWILQLRFARRARVPRRQIALFEPRGGEQAAKRRDLAQAVPFVDADENCQGMSAAVNDGRLAIRRIVHQGRQGGLGLAQSHRSHGPLRTNVVALACRAGPGNPPGRDRPERRRVEDDAD